MEARRTVLILAELHVEIAGVLSHYIYRSHSEVTETQNKCLKRMKQDSMMLDRECLRAEVNLYLFSLIVQ